ncbi:cytochrome P450 [Sphingorhabdus sp. Alg239-R122]|uniref:cytochrome P450 n=1 Tax=Sphingorhabdus sp. Alg239-R122 TaxID=2305989 RepID=UPI0013DD4E8F|nr:cytochrome P450 [Sphingorhabdus sp. Alg239-R122]
MATAHAYTDAGNPHWTPVQDEGALMAIPGEEGIPFFGVTLRQLKDPYKFGFEMYKKHGPIYRINSFGRTQVGMLGAEANELVLFDRAKIFSSEQGWGPVLNLLFPRGLMLMDFDHHRADRKALSIAFKPGPMRHYAEKLNEGIMERVNKWSGQDLRFYPEIKKLTLDLAATSFLGIPWGPEADKINKAFVDMVQASIGVVRRPLPFTKMGRGVAGRDYLVDYFAPEVQKRREQQGPDMFSQFCRATHDNGELLSTDEVVDHMNFLMMAAHDTITSSATSLLLLLAQHPDWQERLREECMSVGVPGQPLSHDDLAKLELTEYAFKEALRLIPPVPSTPRRALKDFEFAGQHVPAGTPVGISAGFTHLMEEYWPDPYKFDPMRFTPDKVRERHKFAWVPFGGGAHMCLGLHFAYMQIKILMHHILTQNRIVVEDGYDPKWQAWPIPQPKDGLKVRFEKL